MNTSHFLQTDDKGVFASDLSDEYSIVAQTFGLSNEEVWTLSEASIDQCFASDATKDQLKCIWKDNKPCIS